MNYIETSTANDIVQKKIRTLELANELLTKQEEITDLNIKLLENNKQICVEKKRIMLDMKLIYGEQKNNFREDLQNMILQLTNELNALDTPQDDIKLMIETRDRLQTEFERLYIEYNTLENSIPSAQEVINTKIYIQDLDLPYDDPEA